jgi:hypothetical protein
MTRAVPNIFGSLTSPQLPNLDSDFSALTPAVVLPCTAAGTNAYVLTPQSATLTVTAYSDKELYSFDAPATSTGSCTIAIGVLPALNLYAADRVTVIGSGAIVTGAFYIVGYLASLNSGAGGFFIASASANGVVSGTYANATVTVGADGRVTGIASGSTGVGSGFFKNLRIANNPSAANTQINASAAVVIAANSSFNNSVAITNFSATINLTVGTAVSQANGMDGESPTASAPLYIYAISTASGPAGLASLSTLVPNLPPGVTQFTRIGAVCLDSSLNLFRTLQIGSRVSYTLTSGTNTTSLPLLASGTVGSVSTPTYVAVSLNSFIPSTARTVLGTANGDAGSGVAIIIAPNPNYGPYVSTISPPPLSINNGGAAGGGQMFNLELESQQIYWAANASSHLWAIGWEDNLP